MRDPLADQSQRKNVVAVQSRAVRSSKHIERNIVIRTSVFLGIRRFVVVRDASSTSFPSTSAEARHAEDPFADEIPIERGSARGKLVNETSQLTRSCRRGGQRTSRR